MAPNPRSQEIVNAFSRYVKSSDRAQIENFSPEEIEFALIQYSADKGWPPHVAMEMRLEELRRIHASSPGTGRSIQNLGGRSGDSVEVPMTEKSLWLELNAQYYVSKPQFAKSISFVKESHARNIILRDIAQAYGCLKAGFYKPAVILAGGVIEELLRRFLANSNVKAKGTRFVDLLIACDDAKLLKRAVTQLGGAVRDFRNLVSLARSNARNSGQVAILGLSVPESQHRRLPDAWWYAPNRCCGAMPMPYAWLTQAGGWCAWTRYPMCRC